MSPARGPALWRALRPHQWAKNLLVFVPLALTPAMLGDGARWLSDLWAFVALSAVASAGYLVNDLLDLEADRAHPSKRFRPFASGELGPALGIAWAVGLVLVGFGLALARLPGTFVAVLAVYLAGTLAYSLYLKRQLLIDVLTLAGLYSLRLLAGGAAVEIHLTPWLLAFSMFLFLGLAFAKRYAELQSMAEAQRSGAAGRAYRVEDLGVVLGLGTTSTYLSVLVFCLYITSSDVESQYGRIELLWLMVPLLVYWVSRVWLLARRGELSGDPVAFAVRDPASWISGAMAALVVALAIQG